MLGPEAQELTEPDDLDDEHIEDEREGGADMSAVEYEHGMFVRRRSATYLETKQVLSLRQGPLPQLGLQELLLRAHVLKMQREQRREQTFVGRGERGAGMGMGKAPQI